MTTKALYQEIGALLHKIRKSGEFMELTCNQYNRSGWDLTGYSGYDAYRLSKIEDTEDGERLKELLEKLDAVKE